MKSENIKKFKTVDVKKLSVVILCVLAVLCVTLALVFSKDRTANAGEYFNFNEQVVLTKNSKAYDGFMGGRTGYKFSTTENGATIYLTEKMSGNFSADFIPVSSVRGENQFSGYGFTFESENSNLSFTVGFSPLTDGVLMSLTLSNNSLVSKSIITEGSFSNLSGNAIKFAFNPNNMVITDAYGKELADLKSEELMNTFYSNNVFEAFTEYSVKMSFSGVQQGKTASVVLFNIGGQELSGENIINSSAPVIVGDVLLDNGVKGKQYNVKTDIKTYDFIDGFKTAFDGDIKLYDSEKNVMALDGTSFVPLKAGKYYVCYTPKDSSGLYGNEYQYSIVIFETQPEINLNFEYPVADMAIGAGETILLPSVTANSFISKNILPVSATLKNGGETVLTVEDCSNGIKYTFQTTGNYTLDYVAKDSTGNSKIYSVAITVTDNKIFDNFDIEREYRKNSNLDLSSVGIQGENVFADTVVVFPDGRKTTSKTVLLDMDGLYSVKASATSGTGAKLESLKYFNVKTDNAYLWKATAGLTVESNASAPSYADFDYNGTMLTVSRPLEIEYENIININDNTADDILFELFVAPVTAGLEEVKCVELILTDVYDESNVLVIRLEDGPWGYYPEKTSVLTLRSTDYKYSNPYAGSTDVAADVRHRVNRVYYDKMVMSSLYGKVSKDTGTYPSQSVKFYFDYNTGLLYANYASTLTSSSAKALVGDFTEEAFLGIGQGNAFKGFTTGEAKLTVKLSSLQQTAHVLMLNVDGQSMSGQYNSDTTAPSIFLDYKGNSENNLPIAQVGKQYKIFPATAIDTSDGKIDDVNFDVFKQVGETWQAYANLVDSFIPDAEGLYKIVYSTADVSGNVGTKEIIITAKNSVPAKEYVFSSLIPSNVTVGNEVRIYDGVASGSSGALSTELKVLYGTEEVTLDKDGCFVPEKDGIYSVSVIVKDYVEASAPFIFNITATYSANPIISEQTMPKAIRINKQVVFPTFTAKLYSASGIEDVPTTIEVDGVTLADNAYTPTQAGTVTVTVKAGGASKDYQVQVVSAGEEFISGIFKTTANVAVETTGVEFTSSSDTVVYLTEKIDADFISTGVSVENGQNMQSISVIFTDSLNPQIKVTVDIVKFSENKSKIIVDGFEYEITGTFFDNGNTLFSQVIEYNVNERAIYVAGTKISVINKTDDGKIFNGFESGAVYIQFSMNGVTAESAFMVKSVAKQNLSSDIFEDLVGPVIQVFGSIANVDFGESFTVPTAEAFDIFSGVNKLTVTVTAPGGTKIVTQQPANQPYSITVDKYGTYNVLFEAFDTLGNKSTRRLSVSISDRTLPVITLKGEMPLKGKVGEEIKLPEVETVEGLTYTLLYCAPDGKYMIIKDYKFVLEQKGTYVIQYFAQYESGASNTKLFRITVE